MMFTSYSNFIGIDPTAGQRPFAYAMLDSNLRLLAMGHGELDEVLAFVAGQRQAVVAVSAPRLPNQGLMDRPEVRNQLNPQPRPGRWTNFRLAEFLLRQHNISSYQTPAKEEDCPNWMQVGFHLYRRLEGLGYSLYPSSESTRQVLEVYPHASYTILLGQAPYAKHSLEGRLQRQLVLTGLNINVPEPMRFFQEITRHHLFHGILPDENIYSPYELDALIAAYTAWLATTHPEQITRLGDPREGEIILPCRELQSRY
jgi:hypothetical protein